MTIERPIKSRIAPCNLFVVILLTLFCPFTGCRKHAEVTSPEAQTLILRFYTACNTKSPERLKAATKIYKDLVASNQITESEQESFNKITQLAENGNWTEASDMAYEFSEAQVR